MKHVIAIAICTIISGILLGQGITYISSAIRPSKYPTYNANTTAPPIGLPEAYALAQKTIGSATNTFYCVTASCIETTNAGYTGWSFSYANTNGQRGRVMVYFDGQASVVAHQGEVIIQR